MDILNRIIEKIRIQHRINTYNSKDGCRLSRNIVINDKSILHGMNTAYNGCDLRGADIGYMTYMGANCNFKNTQIGRYCAIASNVKVIYGEHPTSKFVSIHDIFYSKDGYNGVSLCDKDLFEEYKYAGNQRHFCVIGNDVWLGQDVRIMEGVTVNDGAIVAAGSLVTKDVPPYAIIGGYLQK